MVKAGLLLFVFSVSALVFSQNLSLGVGARANNNWINIRDQFNFEILDNKNDTLVLSPIQGGTSINSGLSIPIYGRYTSKRNWWIQANYGYEIWRLGIRAESTPTNSYIKNDVNEQIEALMLDPNDEDIKGAFTDKVLEENTTTLQSFERVQYNKLSFAFGSSLNRKGMITFYYGAGFDFYTRSTLESYRGLVYDNEEVPRQYEILESMPTLESAILAPFFNFGLEKQNIRLGLDFAFYSGPVFGEHQDQNINTRATDFSSQYVKNISSIGVNLNYTLFNQNFNQTINTDKKNVLDPLVIGRYKQKPKLIQYGLSLNFPSFLNRGWSEVGGLALPLKEDIELDRLLKDVQKDNYLPGTELDKINNPNEDDIIDYLYLEKQDEESFVNEDGNIDTIGLTTTVFFDGGNMNSILKTPKLSGFIRVNPHELFSAELNMGYQNHTYGIVAYETESETIDGETSVQTRKLVYQENFHELSFGLFGYGQMSINNISRLGFHIGLNYNMWFNGTFQTEVGGINDSELLEDFHDYNTGQLEGKNVAINEEAEEWNANINKGADKGVFTKQDYYNHTYADQNDLPTYHLDYSPYLIDTWQKRSYFELRFGLDYYIENLKFNIYAEHSLGRFQTMYNSLFTIGMGVSLFLN